MTITTVGRLYRLGSIEEVMGIMAATVGATTSAAIEATTLIVDTITDMTAMPHPMRGMRVTIIAMICVTRGEAMSVLAMHGPMPATIKGTRGIIDRMIIMAVINGIPR